MAPDRVPVIIGVGEINDRPPADAPGLDSVELMAEALRRADSDAGGGWLARADWLAIVPQIAFRQLDPVTLLPAQLGIMPAQVMQAPSADGDSPVRHLNDAANAIAGGEAQVCLLAGGEAVRTSARRAAAAGETRTLFAGSLASASPLRKRYGLINPADIYPFYENATRAAWGQTLAEGQAETGLIWSNLSQVAAEAEGAWLKTPRSAEEITTPSAANPPLAFPYSKLQVANSSVNQGAALIVTSLARARAARIDEARLVYIGAGAAAHEARDPLARAAFTGTPGMAVTLGKVMELNGLTAPDLDHVELYACFPCVPKLARRQLGLAADRPLSVHGGLTFGGGPIGNYMAHAAVAMVRKLRTSGHYGLLYGNGGHCTDNHAIVLSRAPLPGVRLPQSYDFQAEADARRGAVPAVTDDYEGPAMLESWTVFHDRAGLPDRAVVLARNEAGDRIVARIDGDEPIIAAMLAGAIEPVGRRGCTRRQGEYLHWSFDTDS
ncbi:MAG: acetyl-CoA acetyltransferase [Sphingomonadales bacterium]|nr:acetyl-CoA acetyltransferase [Sphingomonadales bacterium]